MHAQPVTRQYQVLPLARQATYCRAQEVSETGLVLICRIGALYLVPPFLEPRDVTCK
jgi:hypothetical protein